MKYASILKIVSPFLLILALLPSTLVQTGCANIVPPMGGPRDSLPPRLVKVNPRDSATNFTGKKVIEPDKKKIYRKEKVVISPADITTVSQQIVTVWEKIQNREFYIGCGKADCHWCNFVKTNKMAIALHDLAEEEENQG